MDSDRNDLTVDYVYDSVSILAWNSVLCCLPAVVRGAYSKVFAVPRAACPAQLSSIAAAIVYLSVS